MVKKDFDPLAAPAARKKKPVLQSSNQKRANALTLKKMTRKRRPQNRVEKLKPVPALPPSVPSKVLMNLGVKTEKLGDLICSHRPLALYLLNRATIADPTLLEQLNRMSRKDRLVLKYGTEDKEELHMSDDDETSEIDSPQVQKKRPKFFVKTPVTQAFIDRYIPGAFFQASDVHLKYSRDPSCLKKAIAAKFLSYAEEAEKLIEAKSFFTREDLALETTGYKWSTYRETMNLQLLLTVSPPCYEITVDAEANPRVLFESKKGKAKVTKKLKTALKKRNRKESEREKLFHRVYPSFKVCSDLYPKVNKKNL